MMKSQRTIMYLFLFLILQLASISQLQAQTKWHKFTSPDNDFIINFPGEPNYSPHLDIRTGIQIERFSFTFKNHYMELQYVELALRRVTKEQIAASLDGVKSGYLRMLNSSGGRLLRLLDLPEGGYQFESIVYLNDGTPAHNRTRIYVLGSRQYTVSCVTWNKGGLDEQLTSRFFNSFSLFGSSPAKPKYEKETKEPSGLNRKSSNNKRVPKPKKET